MSEKKEFKRIGFFEAQLKIINLVQARRGEDFTKSIRYIVDCFFMRENEVAAWRSKYNKSNKDSSKLIKEKNNINIILCEYTDSLSAEIFNLKKIIEDKENEILKLKEMIKTDLYI